MWGTAKAGQLGPSFNGFSRRWIEGPGSGNGHLFKTTDAGATWTDVSGNLPDVPVNDFSRGKIDASVTELKEEKSLVGELLGAQ